MKWRKFCRQVRKRKKFKVRAVASVKEIEELQYV
jgi:hypothetical protein